MGVTDAVSLRTETPGCVRGQEWTVPVNAAAAEISTFVYLSGSRTKQIRDPLSRTCPGVRVNGANGCAGVRVWMARGRGRSKVGRRPRGAAPDRCG
jgi:hypothetical protein